MAEVNRITAEPDAAIVAGIARDPVVRAIHADDGLQRLAPSDALRLARAIGVDPVSALLKHLRPLVPAARELAGEV